MMSPCSWSRAVTAALVACLTAAALSSCAGAAGTTPSATPSPAAAVVPDVALPDFNSRLGSNRLAAEAGALLGRQLYANGQYWEVYVRTSPATLPGTYDPAQPAASAPAAAAVTQADVVIATEAAAAIRGFLAGGETNERAVLTSLDALIRRAFPNVGLDTVRVFFGESFQHGSAVFDHGKLTQYTVRKLG